MNKNAIQKFAVWARTEMIAQVSQRAYQYGITAEGYGEENAVTVNGRALSTEEQHQRAALVQQIKAKGYEQVVEEIAYTWFNRFIALRFMEVNNVLPSHVRIFSDASGAFKPEILDDALHLELDGLDKEKVAAYIDGNQTDDLYRYLLLTQCNALNSALPGMFERLGSYTELLLPNNILKADGILGRLVTDIPEEDWHDQVQIIGWLYQYYNEEFKEETYALLKKNVKVTKERIPSATQLFTPDWIVRYMVENSLGRLYINDQLAADSDHLTEVERIEREKAYAEKMGWKYYLPEATQEPDVRAQIQKLSTDSQSLTTIKVIDPCMGSGHILVYAFDVLIQIYEASGISQRDAAQQILKNNLYGLDIDDRAAQLAYFAVMMKARQYDRRIFTRGIQPHLYALQNSQPMHEEGWAYFGPEEPLAFRLWNAFTDAKTLGSLVPVDLTLDELAKLRNHLAEMDSMSTLGSLSAQAYIGQILDTFAPLIKLAEILIQKYDVVITNPPYMGSSNMDKSLSDFVKKQYPNTKSDLSTIFMEKTIDMCNEDGCMSMINIPVWMFLSSYEKLRKEIIANNTIWSMVHPGRGIFGSDFGTTAFVIGKRHYEGFKGTYLRLFEKQGEVKSVEEREKVFLSTDHRPLFTANQSNFSKIPGSPVAYWVSDAMLNAFSEGKSLQQTANPKVGLQTGENDRFVRMWYEVSDRELYLKAHDRKEASQSNKKWFPYNKGGDFRKWYGNNDCVVNWKDDGQEIRDFKDSNGKLRSRPQNMNTYFHESVTWSKISSGIIAFRYKPFGHIYDVAGTSIFSDHDDLIYLLAFCNSNVAMSIAKILSPTINYEVGHIASFPILNSKELKKQIIEIGEKQINLSKNDWNSEEQSWEFQRHPLV